MQIKVGAGSPWGQVQGVEIIADGIVRVWTAGHGGVWIDQEKRKIMKKTGHAPFTGDWAWWEEDCDMAKVLSALGV